MSKFIRGSVNLPDEQFKRIIGTTKPVFQTMLEVLQAAGLDAGANRCIAAHSIDFIIRADDLLLEPKNGDLIHVGNIVHEVNDLGNGCWKWCGPHGIMRRIHTGRQARQKEEEKVNDCPVSPMPERGVCVSWQRRKNGAVCDAFAARSGKHALTAVVALHGLCGCRQEIGAGSTDSGRVGKRPKMQKTPFRCKRCLS